MSCLMGNFSVMSIRNLSFKKNYVLKNSLIVTYQWQQIYELKSNLNQNVTSKNITRLYNFLGIKYKSAVDSELVWAATPTWSAVDWVINSNNIEVRFADIVRTLVYYGLEFSLACSRPPPGKSHQGLHNIHEPCSNTARACHNQPRLSCLTSTQ